MKYRLLEKNDKKTAYITEKESFLLSKNDLCTINLIPGLVKAGINALKIEGRMKSPEYVGIVTKIYRKYIDMYYEDRSGYCVDPEDIYRLTQIFSRDLGIGYLKDKYPQDIVSLKKSGSIGNFIGRVYKIDYGKNASGKSARTDSVYIKSDAPLNEGDILEVWTKKGNRRLTVGQVELVEKGSKKNIYKLPVQRGSDILLKDRVFKYFDKKIDEEVASLYKYNKSRVPGGRGEILNGLADKNNNRKYLEDHFFIPGGKRAEINHGTGLMVTVNAAKKEQARTAFEGGADHIVLGNFGEILDKSYFSSEEFGWLLKKMESTGSQGISIDIPDIIYDDDIEALKDSLRILIENGIKSFRISNIGALRLLKDISKEEDTRINIRIGHSLNIFNTFSAVLFKEYCSDGIILKGLEFSPELNLEEISGTILRIHNKYSFKPVISIFSYGFFPVMKARYKISDLINGYKRSSDYYLEDSKNYNFRIAGGYNGDIMIFNSKKICTLFDLDKILGSMITNVIIDGRFLDNRKLQKVIATYRETINILKNKGPESYHRFVLALQEDTLFKDYSKGHIFRGVN